MKKQSKQKQTSFEDDGRVIAPMNVEGMPWFAPKGPEISNLGNGSPQELSKEEAKAYRGAALKAGLAVAGVFVLSFFLFVLFCVKVWFR